MDTVFLATDVVSAYIYAVIFALLFIIGYVRCAEKIYDIAELKGDTVAQALVWYPIARYIALGRIIDKKKLGITITVFVSLTALSVIATALVSVITGSLWFIGFILCMAFYLATATLNFFLYKALFSQQNVNLSVASVVFISLVPLFKLYMPYGEQYRKDS